MQSRTICATNLPINIVNGDLFAMEIGEKYFYGENDKYSSRTIKVFIEDDSTFFETDCSFANDWLDDLILVAQQTKKKIANLEMREIKNER